MDNIHMTWVELRAFGIGQHRLEPRVPSVRDQRRLRAEPSGEVVDYRLRYGYDAVGAGDHATLERCIDTILDRGWPRRAERLAAPTVTKVGDPPGRVSTEAQPEQVRGVGGALVPTQSIARSAINRRAAGTAPATQLSRYASGTTTSARIFGAGF